MTMAIAGLLAVRWHLSVLVQNLATMLGLGLGIDYALLMVSRFREAISAGHNGTEASVIAARQAGHTLLISASTVAIGFLALLTVPISEIRSIGIAGFLVAGISVLLANTLVPALLALLGPRINAGRMPFTAKLDAEGRTRTGKPLEAVGEDDRRASLAGLCVSPARPCCCSPRRPRGSIPSFPRGDWLPPAAESVHALHDARKDGPRGHCSIVARNS